MRYRTMHEDALKASTIREAKHREYLEYKREIMEMDERSAAREAAKEAD